jgi:signal transduction histidine kinase
MDPRTGAVLFIAAPVRPPGPDSLIVFGFASDTAFVNQHALRIASLYAPVLRTGSDSVTVTGAALRVLDERGIPLFDTGRPVDTLIAARLQLGAVWGRWTVEASLLPAPARDVLTAGLPPSPLTYLGILLGLAVLLLGAAGLLVWRMMELARVRTDFTWSLSHELRTPLTQILLYADTLELRRDPTPAYREKAIDVIRRETHRLIHLVDNLLRFSRAERSGVGWSCARMTACNHRRPCSPMKARSGRS